jgi:hypothetical protein
MREFHSNSQSSKYRAIIAVLCLIFLFLMIGTSIGGSSGSRGYTKDTLTNEVNAGILMAEASVMRAHPTGTLPPGIQKCESGDPGMADDAEKLKALEAMAEVNLIRAECGMSVGDGKGTAKPSKKTKNMTPYEKSAWKKSEEASENARTKHDAKSAQERKDECKGGKKHYYHTDGLCSLNNDGKIEKVDCPSCSAGMNPPKDWKATKTEEYGPFWDPLSECWRWVIILYGVP